MSNAKNIRLSAVPETDYPAYPATLCDPHLSSDYFTAFWHDRWLASRLHLTARLDVQGAAMNLFWYARKQTPVGSLPIDEDILHNLLRISREDWLALMAQDITPLHNWSKYRNPITGKIVYGHPVVMEVCEDALMRREVRKAKNEGKAVYQQQRRLAEAMQQIKCPAAMCEDKVLIERLDDWLITNHRGQRRMPQFETSLRKALDHAEKAGWVSRSQHGY